LRFDIGSNLFTAAPDLDIMVKRRKLDGLDTTQLPGPVAVHSDIGNLVDLDAGSARRLQGLYEFVSKQLPAHNSTPSADFATLYKPTAVDSIQSLPLKTLPRPTQTSKTDGNNILVLRGQPCPEWLVYVGETYKINPDFFVCHLESLTNLWEEHQYAKPFFTPATKHGFAQFTYVTLGEFPANAGIEEYTNLNQMRTMAEREMTEYLTSLEGNINKGASAVRKFHVLDEKHFAIEQQASICFQQIEEKSWTGMLQIPLN
jgi:hypothetical protein